ncbi:MAG: DUF302 domain-containing protein [Bacteroidales bacterium]|nr:DUF302 domain-containing protein [Bacteroidales bacterium]
MNRMLTGIIIGVVSGLLLGLLIVFFISPSLMFREDRNTKDFETTVADLEKAIENQGWKTPVVHDLQATMKKFGKDVRSVKVLEICNPDLSYEILSQNDEMIVSSMMPCRISVDEKEDDSFWISRMNTGFLSRPMSPLIRKTMSKAAREVEEIIADVMKE